MDVNDVIGPPGSVNRRVVAAALEALGCREIEVRKDKVMSTCPNESQHSDGKDTKPSHAVMVRDNPKSAVCVCLACGFQESLETVLFRAYWERGLQVSEFVIELMWGTFGEEESDENSLAFQLLAMSSEDFFSSKVTRERQRAIEWKDLLSLDGIPYEPLPESMYKPYAGSVPLYAIETRKLTLETCKEWELGHDRKRSRLLIPSRNIQGQLVGVSGRMYINHQFCPKDSAGLVGKEKRCPVCQWEHPPKYLNSRGHWRRYTLFGEDKLKLNRRHALVFEGQLNAIAAWQMGAINTVCTFGSKITTIQLAKMKEWFDAIWVWGDPDAAGQAFDQRIVGAFEDTEVMVHLMMKKPDRDPGKLLEDGEAHRIIQCLIDSKYPSPIEED